MKKQSHLGSYQIIAPSGLPIAVLMPGRSPALVSSMIDGLDCGTNHETDEQAFKYVVHQYELLTTTRMERVRNRVSALSNRIWSATAAIAAIIAAILSALNYCSTSGGSGAP